MITINPAETPIQKMVAYLQGAVSPRPIAFASTISAAGEVNLSPFSFFNMFSMNPPILVFSPSRRVRDNSTKHTLQNVLEVAEVTINIVNYAMVERASLASCDFPKGTNEFIKAGFTAAPSQKVKPPRVLESPISFECVVNQIVPLGAEGGAGNLVVCQVVLMHIHPDVLDEQGKINPWKVDAVARMGGDYYCRAQGNAIFSVPKPNEKVGIGIDQLPHEVRTSSVLTGNDLGRLANVAQLPDEASIKEFQRRPEWITANQRGKSNLHHLAQQFLHEGMLEEALKTLL